MSKQEKVVFKSEDGENLEFHIVEQTTINNIRYILATDVMDDEVAYILKETFSDSAKEESVFEFVEDERELDAISKVFEQLLDDIDIEL
jgi:hypothetical protein